MNLFGQLRPGCPDPKAYNPFKKDAMAQVYSHPKAVEVIHTILSRPDWLVQSLGIWLMRFAVLVFFLCVCVHVACIHQFLGAMLGFRLLFQLNLMSLKLLVETWLFGDKDLQWPGVVQGSSHCGHLVGGPSCAFTEMNLKGFGFFLFKHLLQLALLGWPRPTGWRWCGPT